MNEKKKTITEMSNKEILRHQLELLAKISKGCAVDELEKITSSMVAICVALEGVF